MATIPGASRFANQAVSAARGGNATPPPSILGSSSVVEPTGLLDAGRGLAVKGFGLSSGAKAVNQAFLGQKGLFNQLLSLSIGPDASVEGARQQILALRSSLPESQLSREALGSLVDEEA